ncbi:Cd209 antigen-like protein c [Plakobranchus ocellatus]|uniref:Cd209 antigen-like protein c n=1 Tax=Plakobranchus ocellatus TaxID=259542 RepID=A0AAV4CZT7_9GAST|nr:Cd209 antigen-like protein c [Plakobranchus ocellatus]
MSGHTYLLSKERPRFDIHRMNQLCKEYKGYLVEVDTISEQVFLRKYLRRKGYLVDIIYTGFTDLGSEGKFYHIESKKPMPNLTWKWWNPDNWKNEEHCVNLANDGMNDLRCNAKGRYLCELNYELY